MTNGMDGWRPGGPQSPFPGSPSAAGPAGPTDSRPAPRHRGGAWTVIATILLALSVVANGVLLLTVIGLAAGFSASLTGGVTEEALIERVVQKGPASSKVAVLRLEGIINETAAESLAKQIERAADDPRVKAVILRINSPGGGLTASDMIYHDLTTYLAATDKPIIAAMDSVAASGGYYVACAADRIIAQPTTITGSIGVIAQLFFLQGLMQDKLGITPVTLKMGEQKDWPNMFGAAGLSEEQREYLMKSLLEPGYERFVNVVAEGRAMDRNDVLRLATGRIFLAPEALQAGLVDEVDYFDRVVEAAMEAAGIDEARVIEYVEPFSLGSLLSLCAKAGRALDLAPEKLASLASPKVMYLWTGF
ncbi:MAG: signal peptide peptidase SppA [Phycisphaerae bacterium]